jgi:enamine deaminase RidA (YjgF/YER057c/UK114 family)
MPIQRVSPEDLRESPLYSHVVRTGNLVFIAGQVAQDTSGQLVGVGDFPVQAAQVFDNLSRALASVGATLENLVKITIYITDPRFRDPLREVNRRYLPADQPTSTLLVVAGLARPEYLIEIDAVAALD